jgi:hypothetical protein
MMTWSRGALIALVLVMSSETSVRAQDAARQEGTSGSNLLAWILFFLPILVVLFFLIPVIRMVKRNTVQITRSLEISEESLELDRERVALQKETNELLKQLIAKQSRF